MLNSLAGKRRTYPEAEASLNTMKQAIKSEQAVHAGKEAMKHAQKVVDERVRKSFDAKRVDKVFTTWVDRGEEKNEKGSRMAFSPQAVASTYTTASGIFRASTLPVTMFFLAATMIAGTCLTYIATGQLTRRVISAFLLPYALGTLLLFLGSLMRRPLLLRKLILSYVLLWNVWLCYHIYLAFAMSEVALHDVKHPTILPAAIVSSPPPMPNLPPGRPGRPPHIPGHFAPPDSPPVPPYAPPLPNLNIGTNGRLDKYILISSLAISLPPAYWSIFPRHSLRISLLGGEIMFTVWAVYYLVLAMSAIANFIVAFSAAFAAAVHLFGHLALENIRYKKRKAVTTMMTDPRGSGARYRNAWSSFLKTGRKSVEDFERAVVPSFLASTHRMPDGLYWRLHDFLVHLTTHRGRRQRPVMRGGNYKMSSLFKSAEQALPLLVSRAAVWALAAGTSYDVKTSSQKGVKNPERTAAKLFRSYGGDWPRLCDLTRTTLVCDTMEQVGAVLRAIQADTQVKHVSTKMRLGTSTKANAMAAACFGYRDIQIGVIFCGEEAKRRGIADWYICEVQVHLRCMLNEKSDQGHKEYVKWRDTMGE